MSGGSRPLALLLVLVLTVLPLAGQETRAAPQITIRTELELATFGIFQPGSSPTVLGIGVARLDLRLAFDSSALVLRLDPGVLAGPIAQSTWGLTEAYLEWRRPQLDIRAGVERLPLETARLAAPFVIEPIDAIGTRQGILGARLDWYPDHQTRLRLAVLEHDGRLHPAVSLRRALGSFEVEAHALGFGSGRTALGLGTSGLVGGLVAYGEFWALTAPAETRYAVGISGSIPDGLWTAEVSYGQELAGPLARLRFAEAPLRLQLAGQIMRRLREDLTLTATARVFSDDEPYRAQTAVEIARTVGDTTYSLALIALLGPQPPVGVITTSVRLAF